MRLRRNPTAKSHLDVVDIVARKPFGVGLVVPAAARAVVFARALAGAGVEAEVQPARVHGLDEGVDARRETRGVWLQVAR